MPGPGHMERAVFVLRRFRAGRASYQPGGGQRKAQGRRDVALRAEGRGREVVIVQRPCAGDAERRMWAELRHSESRSAMFHVKHAISGVLTRGPKERVAG